MAEAAFLTVCSADTYRWFIPLFVYSAKRAYPEYHVRVFVRGKLDPPLTEALDVVRSTVERHWEVADGCFPDVPVRPSTCNCLRYLLPKETLLEFKYAMFTDVDMVIFRHQPTHAEYYAGVMKATGQPFAGVRGALRRPIRKVTRGYGWDQHYHRIVGGLFAIRPALWLRTTATERRRYVGISRQGNADGRDGVPWAAYPEYDEVMLARMIKWSGLKLPMRKFRFVDETRFNMEYRDVHLGDFEGERWRRCKKELPKRLTPWAIRRFRELEKEQQWLDLVKMCCVDERVRRLIHNLRVYTEAA